LLDLRLLSSSSSFSLIVRRLLPPALRRPSHRSKHSQQHPQQLTAPSTLSLVLHVLTSSPSRNASPSLVSPPDTMESTQSREHPCCVCAAPTNKRCTGCASKNSDETSSFSLFFCSSECQKLVRRLPTPSKTLSNPPCAGLLHAQASLWEEGYSGSLSEAICR
jgi:hypothetical protein